MEHRPADADDSTWRQRAVLVVFGTFLGLLTLEIGLRLTGVFLLWREHRQHAPVISGDGAVRILCVGESTTFLGEEHAYPRQLEQFLNARPDGPRVSVVNAGVPAVTTDYLLARVPGWLDTYQPQIVIAMMGVNDPPAEVAADATPFASLRVVKLVRWGLEALRSPPLPIDSPPLRLVAGYLQSGGLDEARTLLDAELEKTPNDISLLVGRSAVAERSMLPMSATAALTKARELAGTDPDAHLTLLAGLLSVRLYEAANEEAVWLRTNVPPASSFWGGVQFRLSVEVDRRLAAQQLDDAEAVMKMMESFPRLPNDRAFAAHAALLAKARGQSVDYERKQLELATANAWKVSPMTTRNYRQLRELVHAHGGHLVAVQYALRPVAPLEEILNRDPAVLFVSTEDPFRKALAETTYNALFTDVFAGDFGHKTPRGNKLLAETIGNAVLARGWLQPSKAPAQ